MLVAFPARIGAVLAAATLVLLAASSAGAADVKLPDGSVVQKVDFERHLMGVFGRLGCNSGSCHGSFQGKGGFRLSLFAYDPAKDFYAITREANGRRINRADPDSSLILLKATGQVDHGGYKRFGKDSWAYQLIREWIVQGATWTKGSGDLKLISMNPPEYAFTKTGQTGQLTIKATFADNSVENITPLCDYRINDDAIATVNPLGQVKALRPGDTAIIVSYRGQVLPVRVMIPTEAAPGFKYPQVPEVNFIDREVFAKLKRLNIVPSALSSDEEFLRRVTIDTIGTLPTPKEVRDFVADKRADKRERKIDELLVHPMHAALWATKFCDITGNNTIALENQQLLPRAKLSQMWHDWLRKRVAENTPYDEIVRGILCATSRDGMTPQEYIEWHKKLEEELKKGFATQYPERKSLDLFWRRQGQVTVDQWGEKTAAAFLGVRLECAQCHKHPFDRWTQTDYRAFANIYAFVGYGISPEANKAFTAENAERRKNAQNPNQAINLREVFVSTGGAGGKGGRLNAPLPDPETGGVLPPKALGGPEIKGQDPRVVLFEWMRSPDNPFFARSFANRVWGHYFGVGIVHPVDDFSLANPPSNPKLLDALAKDFLDNKYDIRQLERTILLSRTYQLSSTPNETNKLDRNNYSHCYVRPLMAEVVVDVLNAAIGVTENFGNDAPSGVRAIEVGSSQVNGQVNLAFRTFGRPPRSTACDCERAAEPALAQKLFLMADSSLDQKITRTPNRLKELLARQADDKAALEELFLATLTRKPTADEVEQFLEIRKKKTDRQAAFQAALWALINTTEFIFNH
jgi:Protein of unknown function (DUF1549)/Protein of unknown function (DUF1553)